MPSEVDPLLPNKNNESAPEISGDGFRNVFSYRRERRPSHSEQDDERNKDSDRGPDPSDAAPSPLRTFGALFTIVVGLGLLIAWFATLNSSNPAAPTAPRHHAKDLAERVDDILSRNPLIGNGKVIMFLETVVDFEYTDGHNDLAILIRYMYNSHIYDDAFTQKFENGALEMHVDLHRLKLGKVGGTFWSAYVGCPKDGTDFSDENYADAVSSTLSQIDLIRRMTAAYPQVFSTPNLNSSSAADAFDKQHLLISPIGIEGLHQIGNALSNLRLYFSLGVRYATLTHNCHNRFADAAIVVNAAGQAAAATPYWGGMSDLGQTLIDEMNRLGMLVDISHVSKDTMMDILGGRPEKLPGSRAPVIFSHSSAFALCPHPRNVPDDVLELVKETSSLVMVNFSPDFISCTASDSANGLPDFYHPNSTLHQVARHVQYIGEKIGYDHVGLGSDFDGIFNTPNGLEDVSKFPALVSELLEMGVKDDDAAKIVGRNLLRVWKSVDEVSSKMQADGVLPAEDPLKKLAF
ncbi:MAG: hypothetical protein L6R37_003241 [Teloschistes peruensis]|nr:MAG: hypothetical protein L6R37_003241 [Teloschistes peruensis]